MFLQGDFKKQIFVLKDENSFIIKGKFYAKTFHLVLIVNLIGFRQMFSNTFAAKEGVYVHNKIQV